MNYVRATTAALLLGSVGCASKVAIVADAPRSSIPCCKLSFEVFFHPEYRDRSAPDTSITEIDGKVTLEVANAERVISPTGEYAELRKMILSSSQWRDGAQTPYYSMPWSGPPRDILTIRHKESGLNLQGDSVPAEWKRRILRLSRSGGATNTRGE